MSRNNLKQQNGFTLIELLVSIALFTIVMTISVGTLLALVDANRQSQSLKSVVNNLNFALDDMTRTIRTGFEYNCDTSGSGTEDCPNGDVYLELIDDQGDTIEYRFNNSAIERQIDGGGWETLTAPEVNITEMLFYVTGSTAGDTEQPTVTISIRGTAGTDVPTQSEFNLQTTVTQRLLDV